MTLLYADASALVKLVLAEDESETLRAYIDTADVVSSEIVLAEIPRAVARTVAGDPSLPSEDLRELAHLVLDGVDLFPVEEVLLTGAGALPEPSLRTLDAIHVVAALGASPIDAFVTYDLRQGAAARLAGLRTIAPGA